MIQGSGDPTPLVPPRGPDATDRFSSSLSTRNYRLNLIYTMGVNTPLYWPYMYHYVTHTLGLPATQFGALKAIYYFTVVLCEVPFGVIADRASRRATLLLGALACAAGCVLYGVADGFASLAAAEISFGVGTALASGAGSALLFDSLRADGRSAEYARFEGRCRAAALLSTTLALPATGLWLVRGDDPVLAYWVTAGLCFGAVLAAALLLEPPREGRISAAEIGRGSLREVRRNPGVRRLILFGAGIFVWMRAANALVFNPVMTAGAVPLSWWGASMAAIGLVGAAVAWRTDRALARFGERGVCAGMLAVSLAMYWALGVTQTPAVAAVFCLNGVAVGALPVVIQNGINRRVTSSRRRATVLSIESAVSRASYGLAALGVGSLLDRASLTAALSTTVAVGCIPLLLSAWGAARAARRA